MTMPLKRLSLTKIVVKNCPLNVRQKTLVKLWEEQDVEAQWKATPTFKRQDKHRRRLATTDFERFQIRKARREVCTSAEDLFA